MIFDRVHGWVFAEVEGDVEALVRSLIGVLVVWWSLSWLIDAGELLGSNSLYPAEAGRRLSWTLFAVGSPPWFVAAVLVAVALAGAGLAFGRRPRWSAVVAFVGLVSIHRLQPAALNAGDQLLRLLLVWTIATLVLGSRANLTGTVFQPGADRPRVLLVALRFQIVLIYLTSVVWKLQGEAWRNGEAVWSALNNPSVASAPLPDALADTTLGIAALTYLVLATEATLPLLLLRAPRVGIAVSWALHLGFAVFLRVGIFTPVMMVTVLAFLEPGTVRSWLGKLRPPDNRHSTPADQRRTSASA